MAGYNEYLRVYESAMRQRGKPAEARSLDSWRKNCAVIRQAVMSVKAVFEAEKKRMWGDLKADAYFKAIEPLQANYNFVLEQARTMMKNELKSVLNAKREQLSKCLDAPTEDDLRLLNVLNLRTSLSASELAAAADKLNGNINGLRALGDIARRSGLSFPDYGNLDRISHDLEAAERFANTMIKNVDSSDPTYFERMFYDHTELIMPQFEDVDTDFFTTAQEAVVPSGFAPSSPVSEIPVGKQANACRVYLTGSESLLCLASQFNCTIAAIKEANPGIDIHNLGGVESIVIPATKFSIVESRGYSRADQVVPTYLEPISGGEA